MKHSDFKIGAEFTMSGKHWRCTDIGTRVIVAISLEPRNMVRSYVDESGQRVQEKYVSHDPRDLNGPPYGVVESVIDEYDFEACEQGTDTDGQWPAEVEKRMREIDAGAVEMLDVAEVFAGLREKYQRPLTPERANKVNKAFTELAAGLDDATAHAKGDENNVIEHLHDKTAKIDNVAQHATIKK